MSILIVWILSASVSSFASDDMPLSAPFTNLRPPMPATFRALTDAEVRSDLAKIFPALTPVKAQGSRGTCSIFSSTALLESLLILAEKAPHDVNLSEQFLAFLAAHNNRSEGSNAGTNWQLLSSKGTVSEKTLPYDTSSWVDEVENHRHPAYRECGRVSATYQKSCLWAQGGYNRLNSPEWGEVKREASEFRAGDFRSVPAQGWMFSVDQVKKSLRDGVPVVLELSFYYGAWNHRGGIPLGLIPDADALARGEVGFPEFGSLDRAKSPTEPAGHSVLVVGYDDEAEIKTSQLMEDGTTQEFTYRGVYYFKNSWGTDRFGVRTQLSGPTPGYGVITQRYANELGEFFGTIR